MSEFQGEEAFTSALEGAFGDRGLVDAAPEGTPAETAEPDPVAVDDGVVVDDDAAHHSQEQLRDDAGKFASATELQSRLEQLEKRLADKDEFIGRQSTQIGELRQAVEQWQPPQQQPVYNLDALIDENPAQAAEIAFTQNDPYRVQQALAAWKDEDPFSAAVWVADKRREQEFAQLRAEYDARAQPVQDYYQTVQQQQASTDAVSDLASEYGDFGAFAPQVLESIQNSPADLQAVASGDKQLIYRTMKLHYLDAKLRTGDTLTQAAQQQREQAQNDNRAAKQQAVVASASSAPSAGQDTGAKQRFVEAIVNADLGPLAG